MSIDGRDQACIRRTAVQLLFDDYPGSSNIFTDEYRSLIDEMDEILMTGASEVDPLLEILIPNHVPASHWWWRLPASAAT
ncbi:hypothetical protein [Nocardia sp. NPDC056100]|uniref:hypothetical protein n=1 Tax=Nocardia sp. NPDC056100 TaxID=3345712 RepID=UPI0035E28914